MDYLSHTIKMKTLVKNNDSLKEHAFIPTESTVVVQDSSLWTHGTITDHGKNRIGTMAGPTKYTS